MPEHLNPKHIFQDNLATLDCNMMLSGYLIQAIKCGELEDKLAE